MADDKRVVDLAAYRVQRGGGDAGFLHCPVCEGGDFAVVCRGIPSKPYVTALLCVECDPPIEIGIYGGELQLSS